MKLLSTAIAAAALITAADAKGFNGFYVGSDLALNKVSTKNQTYPNNQFNLAHTTKAHPTKVGLGLFLGYNKVFTNCLSLGAEFEGFFNLSNSKTNLKIANKPLYTYTAKQSRFNWDLVAKFGYSIGNKALLFVGTGITSIKTNILQAERDATPVNLKFKYSKIRPIYQLGTEYLVSDSVGIRLVYSYSQLKKSRKSTTNGDSAFGPNIENKLKQSQHQVKLGVSYKF